MKFTISKLNLEHLNLRIVDQFQSYVFDKQIEYATTSDAQSKALPSFLWGRVSPSRPPGCGMDLSTRFSEVQMQHERTNLSRLMCCGTLQLITASKR